MESTQRRIVSLQPLVISWPVHGLIGLVLIVTFWVLNWSLTGIRTHWMFFALWLGYSLLVDALVFVRKGHSMLTRNPRAYVVLFLISAPSWWLFEIINLRMQNWIYTAKDFFTPLQYFVYASLNFSTVLPAVFGTAELASTFRWIKRAKPGLRIVPTSPTLLAFFIGGWVTLALLLLWPKYFFPFAWLSVYFILEPLNVWLGNRSLATYIKDGNWQPVYALWVGVLICGFFWEMWNYFSVPKWIYQVPFVDWLHIFEMPILGYGGYIPFALELYALYHLVTGFFGKKTDWDYVQITPDR